MADLIRIVGRSVAVYLEPVLIAPHGDAYHVARAILRTASGPVGHTLDPRCGIAGGPWVAVDEQLAEQLGRLCCRRCRPTERGEQLAVSDIDPEEVA